MNASHSSSSIKLVGLQRYLEPVNVCLLESGKVKPTGGQESSNRKPFHWKMLTVKIKIFVGAASRELKVKAEARQVQPFNLCLWIETFSRVTRDRSSGYYFFPVQKRDTCHSGECQHRTW